jgi:hypothetical protein
MDRLSYKSLIPLVCRNLREGKISSEQLIVDIAILIVVVSFLFMESGCSYYKMTTRVNNEPETLISNLIEELYPVDTYPREIYMESVLRTALFANREVYVFDKTGRWRLESPKVQGDSIFATAKLSPVPPANDPIYPEYRRNRKYNGKSEEYIVHRVNLYIDTLQFAAGDTSIIPVSAIKEYDIYAPNTGKSAGIALLIIGGIAVTAAIIISIAVVTKQAADNTAEAVSNSSSCPFIYSFDGQAWQFNGEIFGGATLSTLERDDYLALPKYNSAPGSKYKIFMANFLPEIQFINKADLILISHDSKVEAFIDKYGNIQTVSEPVLPSTAFDSRGTDCLGEIQASDQVTHDFNEEPDTGISCTYLNSIELTFKACSNPEKGKILINAKNSLWGDYIVSGLYRMFGDKYEHWARKQEQQPAGDYMAWMQQQGIPLQVYVMKENEWQMVDYFDMVGAFSSRDMVLPLDLEDAWTADAAGDSTLYSLKVKLVTGYMFWELDYAAIDLSENAEVEQIWIHPDNAVDQDGRDVARLLADDDKQYLVQKETGDHTVLEFTLPAGIGPSFNLYLQSRGYYHQARESSSDEDIALLKTFLEPGKLSLYSYRKFMEAMTAQQSLTETYYY